jgi:pSer/pThr/pTyr-binding forkhead associated (FHA) protein
VTEPPPLHQATPSELKARLEAERAGRPFLVYAVSRLHAEIEHLGGRWTVADDGLSRNRTYLNGERLRGRRRLTEHDRLRFGATNVIYRAPSAAQAPRTEGTSVGTDAAPPSISAAQRRVLLALARPCSRSRRTCARSP